MSSRVKAKQANRMVREQLAAEQRRRRTVIVSIAAAVALVIAGLVGFAVYVNQAPPASYATPAHASGDGSGIQVSSGPVPVDIYIDYLCPNCKRFEDSAQSTLDDLVAKQKVTLVYHPIAILDPGTNPPGYSTRAGSAAGCAADGGKFLEYTKALFAQQPAEGSAGLTDDKLVEIGAGVGLTGDPFAGCVRAEKYSAWIAHNTDTAAGKNINSTPTVLVKGKQITPTPEALLAAVGQ
jgi:protein-disulfide isomerase